MRLFGFEVSRTKQQQPLAITSGFDLGSAGFFGRILEGFSGAWQRNIEIESPRNMLAFSAVNACISLIANDISKLDLMLIQDNADGSTTEIENSPFVGVLQKPNGYQTHIQFINYWMTCKLMHGNAYVIKERNDLRGLVTALHILDPRRVVPLVADDGSVYYQIGRDRLAGYVDDAPVIPASEMIHDRMSTFWHPLVGVSPIYACGLSATHGIKIQSNGAKFFENMSRPSGQLTAPGKITDETAARLKAEFEKNFSGLNVGRLLVSGDGLQYQPMTMPATDAQLIQQLEWTVQDVARAFHVPLHKIQAPTERSTATIASMDQAYFSETLQFHVDGIECLLTEGLELPNPYEVEFDVDNLARMDPASRFASYEVAVSAGVLKPNEARASEGLPPVDGGDECYLQQQNFSLAALAKRDSQPNPFAPVTAPALPAPAAPTVPDTTPPDQSAKALWMEVAAIMKGELEHA